MGSRPRLNGDRLFTGMTDWGELGGQSNVTGDHKGRPYGGRAGWREEEGIKTVRVGAEHRDDMWGRARRLGSGGGGRAVPEPGALRE